MELLLILLAVLLAGVAVAKVLKAKELVDGLKDPEGEPISAEEIKTNALGLLVFGAVLFILAVVQIVAFDKYLLPSSASVHGEETDTLMKITMYLIMTVFFITQGLLFFFGFKYYYRPGKKAFWFPHNNRLEMAWTIVPATVLILLITYGMTTWGNIMNPDEEPDLTVEFVSEQFKWTTRFAGADSTLGEASFALFGKNAVGIATKGAIETRVAESKNTIHEILLVESSNVEGDLITLKGKNKFFPKEGVVEKTLNKAEFDSLVSLGKTYGIDGSKEALLSGLVVDSAKFEGLVAEGWNRGDNLDEAETSLKNYRANIIRLNRMLDDYKANPAKYDAGKDDIVINGNEIKLPKGKKIKFQFRSKDVIHSAYFPHFRAQMNTVPGMKTYFTFTPKETSKEFNEKAIEEGKVYLDVVKDEDGNVISSTEKLGSTGYILLCNKICGASHYNMKVFIDVVEQEEYDKWIAEQKAFEK